MSFLKLPFFIILFSLILSGCGTTPSSSLSSKNTGDQDNDGYSVSQGDCQDGDPTVFPSAPEFQDGKDNDCDGEIDEEEQNGKNENDESKNGEEQNGEGNSTDNGDTSSDDPNDPKENEEPAPPKNDDRNNSSEEYDPLDYGGAFIDKDQDGFVNTDDCNDIDPTIYPYAQEVACNPVDENCDGVVPYPGGGEMWLGGYGDYTTLIECDDYTPACGNGNQNGTVKITTYYGGETVVEYESCSTAHGLIEVVYP